MEVPVIEEDRRNRIRERKQFLEGLRNWLIERMEHFLTHVGKLLLLLQLQVDRRPFLPHHAVIQRKMLACFTHRHGQKRDVLLRWKPPYRHLLLLIETCVLFKFVCVCSLRCDASDYTLRRPTKILLVSVIRCGMLRLKTTYLWVEYDLKALGILKASDDFREVYLVPCDNRPTTYARLSKYVALHSEPKSNEVREMTSQVLKGFDYLLNTSNYG
ncbi:hypothetical protein LXL04_014218 [Taraxacum kok-saghyz]